MTKNPTMLGFILFLLTMVMFFVTYFFFSGVNYYDTTLKMNSFVLPFLYVLAAFWSVKSYWNNNSVVGFRTAFKRAFMPMFIGGLLSMLSIFAFLNFGDTAAKDLLNYQYVTQQKSELDNEYNKAKKLLKDERDIADLEKKYQERIQSFSPELVKDKDMLTFSHFSGYFAAILIFYLVISLFFGAFFKTRYIEPLETETETN